MLLSNTGYVIKYSKWVSVIRIIKKSIIAFIVLNELTYTNIRHSDVK